MREKMICVPAEPISMPTVLSVTWSWIQSGLSSSVFVLVDPVVIVVGILIMLMHEILAVEMVGDRVAGRLFGIIGWHRASFNAQTSGRPCLLPHPVMLWKTRFRR